MKAGITLVAGVAAGAAAQYFLDKQSGARRRHTTRDRAKSIARRQARDVATRADYAAGQAKGKVASMRPTKHEEFDDVTLAHKVESEIFRAADAPKGKVDVNAENGVVFLRGEVEREWIERLERDAEKVNGVKAVRSLLHAPGTPAPTAPSPPRASVH
jgi:osmotically-inducible protein OsmY